MAPYQGKDLFAVKSEPPQVVEFKSELESFSVVFAIRYLFPFVKLAAESQTVVKASFKDEFPIKLACSISGTELTTYVAPRLKKNVNEEVW